MYSLILRLLIGVVTMWVATAFANSAANVAAYQRVAVKSNLHETMAPQQNIHNLLEHTANTVEANFMPLKSPTEDSVAKDEVSLAVQRASKSKVNPMQLHEDMNYLKGKLDNEKAKFSALKAMVEHGLSSNEVEPDLNKTELEGKMRVLDEWLGVFDKQTRLENVKVKDNETEPENPLVQQLLNANVSDTAKENAPPLGPLAEQLHEINEKEHRNAREQQIEGSTSASEALKIADRLMDEIAMDMANGDVNQAHQEIDAALEDYWAIKAKEEGANSSQPLDETKDISDESQETASNVDKIHIGKPSRHRAQKKSRHKKQSRRQQ